MPSAHGCKHVFAHTGLEMLAGKAAASATHGLARITSGCLDLNILSGYSASIDVRLTTRYRVIRRDEEAFRTDSGLATSGRSTQLDLQDFFYGYGNR
jgi:hypothetical protein